MVTWIGTDRVLDEFIRLQNPPWNSLSVKKLMRARRSVVDGRCERMWSNEIRRVINTGFDAPLPPRVSRIVLQDSPSCNRTHTRPRSERAAASQVSGELPLPV